ncbi:MAG: undecaprenyl-diphosphate phosphatase [Gammaproteobacteria bacterium]|nr:undecaprenyl-diphosphate phosphatase [Gammaproteobacteria bacterium]
MDWLQAIVLAVVQGLTEFLPISSSAHLILVPVLTDWPDQGLAFDVAVHVGTLLAVLWYFRAEVAVMARDSLGSLAAGRSVGESRMVVLLAIGTVPVGACGLALELIGTESLRSAAIIATATVVFALALWWSDARSSRSRSEHDVGPRDAFIIGLAQALALIPGTSRSGITLTAGLALGLSRESAARFSFLLSIPVIALAGAAELVELVQMSGPIAWRFMGVAVVLSSLCAYACIHWFLRLVPRIGVLPFVIYRLVLGALLFAFVV